MSNVELIILGGFIGALIGFFVAEIQNKKLEKALASARLDQKDSEIIEKIRPYVLAKKADYNPNPSNPTHECLCGAKFSTDNMFSFHLRQCQAVKDYAEKH